MSRQVRREVRRIAEREGIAADDLAEIGVVMLTAMSREQRAAWRQLARQCGRREQRSAVHQIGETAREVWIEILAARMTR